MKIIILIIIFTCALTFFIKSCDEERSKVIISRNGFENVLMPNGSADDNIYIIAPLNCSCEATQRANELVEKLESLGISTTRSETYAFHIAEPTADDRIKGEKGLEILKEEKPMVFINGAAKSNPSIKDIISEFKLRKKSTK